MDTGTAPDAPFVSIRTVTKDYGAHRVLDGVDLTLAKGDFCTVVGPSGCGKSTLLRLVLGQERPTAGSVTIGGIADAPPDARRGIVYQQYSLFPHLTVLGNVLVGARLRSGAWRRDRAAATADAMRFLERVKLDDAAGRYPYELSGGMQQRVAIAQAAIASPGVLLMDEPFAALDPPTRAELQAFTLDLWKEHGMTVFFVTHDVNEALSLGNRIVLLTQFYEDGSQRGHGARIVMDHDLDPAVFRMGDRDGPAFAEMRARVLAHGFDERHATPSAGFDLRRRAAVAA